MIVTYTLVIMLLVNGISGMTTVPGFTSLEACNEQAAQIQQVQVASRGTLAVIRFRTMCVEVK